MQNQNGRSYLYDVFRGVALTMIFIGLLILPIMCLAEPVTIKVQTKIPNGKTPIVHSTTTYEEEWSDWQSVIMSDFDLDGYHLDYVIVNKVRMAAENPITLNHTDYAGVSTINVVFQYAVGDPEPVEQIEQEKPEESEEPNGQGQDQIPEDLNDEISDENTADEQLSGQEFESGQISDQLDDTNQGEQEQLHDEPQDSDPIVQTDLIDPDDQIPENQNENENLEIPEIVEPELPAEPIADPEPEPITQVIRESEPVIQQEPVIEEQEPIASDIVESLSPRPVRTAQATKPKNLFTVKFLDESNLEIQSVEHMEMSTSYLMVKIPVGVAYFLIRRE